MLVKRDMSPSLAKPLLHTFTSSRQKALLCKQPIKWYFLSFYYFAIILVTINLDATDLQNFDIFRFSLYRICRKQHRLDNELFLEIKKGQNIYDICMKIRAKHTIIATSYLKLPQNSFLFL